MSYTVRNIKILDVIIIFVVSALFGYFLSKFVHKNTNNVCELSNTNFLHSNKSYTFVQQCFNLPQTRNWDYFKTQILKNNDILKNTNADPNKLDLTGWSSIGGFIDDLILQVAKDTTDTFIRIIEVGSWKGQSTAQMGEACKKMTTATKKECNIIAIDSWLGSAEHYESIVVGEKAEAYPINLFTTFLNNIKVKELDTIIFPLRLPSTAAVHVLHCFHIDAHLIYIDADHDYLPVLRDVETFYPLLKKNGVIFGDDYSWGSVGKAVKEFRSTKNGSIKFWDNNRNWFMKKLDEDAMFYIT